ncbi:hypothetical protein DFH28DRAFT_966394 [Melampsora americana]|nr:hypothetical protein DFH28DRAFT_966394 [Melampsora americana]
MATLNCRSGFQYPRYHDIMTDNHDSRSIGSGQDNPHELDSFELQHYHKTGYLEDIWYQPGKYTSTFYLPGMPEYIPRPLTPGMTIPAATLQTTHSGNNEVFSFTDRSMESCNHHIIDQSEYGTNNINRLAVQPLFSGFQENMEKDNRFSLQGDFNMLDHPNLPEFSNQKSKIDMVTHGVGSEQLEKKQSYNLCDQERQNEQLKRPENSLKYEVCLKKGQEILFQNNGTQKPDLRLKGTRIQKKRKKIYSGEGSVISTQSSPSSDEASCTPSHVVGKQMTTENVLTQDSLCDLINPGHQPVSEKIDESNGSVTSHFFEDASAIVEDGADTENTHHVNDVMHAKKKHRRFKLDKDNIYRSQDRSSFDISIEKYVTPFMTEFEKFLEVEMDPGGKTFNFLQILKARMTLLTHEYLLLLAKVTLTYDPHKENLNVTLVEGFKWLKSVWKSVSLEKLYFSSHSRSRAKKSNSINAKITSIEEFMISRIDNHMLLHRNQIRPTTYVILRWMQMFRPLWYDMFQINAGRQFSQLGVYLPHHSAILCLLHQIEIKARQLEVAPLS